MNPAGDAGRILSDVDTAWLEVAELVGPRRGRVRVGATPDLCGSLIADVIERYHDAHPGIRVSVTEGGSRDLVAALEAGSLDLALVIVSPVDADRGPGAA